MHPADDTRSALAAQVTTSRFAGALAAERLSIDRAEFTADGRTMVTRSSSAVVLWDVTHRPPVRLAALPGRGQTGFGLDTGFETVAVAPDGRSLATAAAGRVQLWDVRNPAVPRQAGLGFAVGQTANLGVAPSPRLVFSTSGRMLAVAREDGVQLFDVSAPGTPRALGPPIATGDDTAETVVFDRADRALLTGMQRPHGRGQPRPRPRRRRERGRRAERDALGLPRPPGAAGGRANRTRRHHHRGAGLLAGRGDARGRGRGTR